MRWSNYYPHFKVKQAEAGRREVTCLGNTVKHRTRNEPSVRALHCCVIGPPLGPRQGHVGPAGSILLFYEKPETQIVFFVCLFCFVLFLS